MFQKSKLLKIVLFPPQNSTKGTSIKDVRNFHDFSDSLVTLCPFYESPHYPMDVQKRLRFIKKLKMTFLYLKICLDGRLTSALPKSITYFHSEEIFRKLSSIFSNFSCKLGPVRNIVKDSHQNSIENICLFQFIIISL